jgi:NADH:ubiquinone oxidoreductase subunit F (NADH-binding)
VLDGIVTAAEAVGASEAILAVGRADRGLRERLERAVAERAGAGERVRIRVEAPPERFLAGEESALVHWLGGEPAKPTFTPPRPFERGLRRRPTLILNVETLANVALIARHGAAWFRELGTEREPGSALVTLSGAVARPGVAEVALGTPLQALVERAGGLTEPARGVLVGGYFGTWLRPREALAARLLDADLRPLGAALGARAIVVLGTSSCPLVETARVAAYLAREGAGQCGPCRLGLPALAQELAALAAGGLRPEPGRLGQLCGQIEGRGACRHPDGVVRLVRSSLTCFRDEVELHRRGACSAAGGQHALAIPEAVASWR